MGFRDAGARLRGGHEVLQRADELPDRMLAACFVALGALVMLGQYAMIVHGAQGFDQFYFDARVVWRPLAEGVLGGEPLYGPDQWDNKPPLWGYLNVFVAATGRYFLVFYALVGVAHGITAWLLVVWTRRHGAARIGIVAALLFLGTIPAAFMARIDPRAFAQVLLFAALLTTRASVAGAALAAATTLIQLSAFAAPVIVWREIRDRPRGDQLRWIARFGLAGAAVAVLVFGSLAVRWDVEALRYAIRYTVLDSGHYTRTHSVLVVPERIVGGHVAYATEMLYVVLPAALAAGALLREPRDWRGLRGQSVLLAGSLMAPFFLRPHGMYWYPPLPFLAVLAALGLQSFLAGARD